MRLSRSTLWLILLLNLYSYFLLLALRNTATQHPSSFLFTRTTHL